MNHSAEEWEADRWKSFQNLLIQVGCTNQFHKTRWNEITNAKKLSGFDEFEN